MLINTTERLPVPKIPKHCPACNASLLVTRLTCPECGTEVTGSYTPDLFARLSPNDFDFVVLFLKTRGNVKEMERALGISYWTIRTRLNEIVVQLGLDVPEPPAEGSDARRQSILEQLNAGLITVDEAAARLEELRKK